jgi:hypothetical protein
MRALEKNLWRWLAGSRKALADRVTGGRLHLCRVENSAAVGYPDVEGCYNGRSFHIELKTAERPTRPSTRLDANLSRAQALWLDRRWRVGGSCFVLLQVDSGPRAARYLIPGDLAERLADRLDVEAGAALMSVLAGGTADPLQVIEAAATYRMREGG